MSITVYQETAIKYGLIEECQLHYRCTTEPVLANKEGKLYSNWPIITDKLMIGHILSYKMEKLGGWGESVT